MEIVVTDRESIEAGIRVRSRYVVISIHDACRRRPKVRKQAGLRDVLYVNFDDAEPSALMDLPAGIKLFTATQAKSIWDFVELYRKAVGTIVVHCEQGMSRSPAVAAAIAEALGESTSHYWTDFAPNRHVYETMRGHCPAG